MQSKSIVKSTLTATAFAAALLVPVMVAAQQVTMMTGPQGGSWIPLGGALKGMWEKAIPGLQIQMTPGAGIANVMHFAGVSLADAVQMAVHHPANLLGLDPGALAPGDPADLVLFDLIDPSPEGGPARFKVLRTLLEGEVVFEK